MDLIAYAIPFFLLALLAEIAWDRLRGSGYLRLNDAVASLSAGALSTTSGLFTKAIEIAIYALLLEHVAPYPLDPALFDLSWRGVGLFLVVLLAWDFLYYWNHRLGHTVNVLWAAHVVHHQSEEYNLSTALRQTSTGFVFGWIFYVPLLLVGVPAHVVATAAAVDLIYQFWVHTRHVGSLGWFDRVFVSPSNHRVHHAQNERYLDRNYGGILIIWDRLFGTFQPELADEPCVYGVRKPLKSWSPLRANIQTYRDVFALSRRSRRWGDRIGVWFRRPNWRPADLGGSISLDDGALEGFTRFDTKPPPRVSRYVLMQFIVAAVLTGAISLNAGVLPTSALVLLCLGLWSLLATICGLLESPARGLQAEQSRLVIVNPLLAAVAALLFSDIAIFLAAAVLVYGGISWLLLRLAASAARDGRSALVEGHS
ncbi:MAG: sterol desaturase family protein [Pseudomonadota bacterium]